MFGIIRSNDLEAIEKNHNFNFKQFFLGKHCKINKIV